jgi:hypothetical protein
MRLVGTRQNYRVTHLLYSLVIITFGVIFWLFHRPFFNIFTQEPEQVFIHKIITKEQQCPMMPMLGKPEKIDFIPFPHRTLKIQDQSKVFVEN